MEYNKKKIDGLDPRQLVYIKYHEDDGGQQVVINGQDYYDRVKQHRPEDHEIQNVASKYPDRQLYLDCNARGWAIVIRNESNETMYNWEAMEEIKRVPV